MVNNKEMNRLVRLAIVDDHKLFARSLQYLLEAQNSNVAFECTRFNSGIDFLEAYGADKFDCILLDLNLPQKSGLEILKEVQGIDESANVIILTAYDQSNLVKECMQSGAAGFILKSNTLEELISAIKLSFEGETYLGKGVNLFTAKEIEADEFSNKMMHFICPIN